MLGRIHQLNGRFDDAATSLRTSIALQPVQAAAYFALAYSKSITSGDRDTMQRMEELLTAPGLTESDRAQLHYALGKGFDDLREFYAAMSHFDRANEIAVKSALPFDPAFETKKVDRLIELFPKDRFAKWPGVGSQSNRPIFIVGMIRSGTTLVEQILSRHPDVSPAGELRFWVENEPRFLVDMVRGPDSAPDCPSWRVDYEAELDRVSVSARRITDKMPLNFWAIGLIHIAYPEAKIVHCRRNPLDTCLSIYVTPFRRAPEFGHSRSNIASAYREYFRLMEHWRSVIPASSLIEVDYEQLVSNPETKARELIQACDLDWCDSCLDPAQSSNPVNTPSQWQVRQPVYRGSVDRWRSYAEWLGPIRELADL
jgi:tetratricopeptide (TPR) repeat protein